jgi:hypothetical protein
MGTCAGSTSSLALPCAATHLPPPSPHRYSTTPQADAKKKWDKEQHSAEAVAVAAVASWAAAHPEVAPSVEAVREKQELDERVAQLAALSFEYPGPM